MNGRQYRTEILVGHNFHTEPMSVPVLLLGALALAFFLLGLALFLRGSMVRYALWGLSLLSGLCFFVAFLL
ncbi:hypothetical protein [Deinococcus hopiensis]|uniref:Uncharacterized protein n=1 Tax=Deinococcus hopiensis KR-140 TaxID=695939 RepID=A0A1W1V7H9_9DEIO|nr:hypothetical protein [Deinococcus hopiensis]SMB89236.1 hypothetical protein SAMN00790413_00323 [Deinococcus hopiensis KR-140]